MKKINTWRVALVIASLLFVAVDHKGILADRVPMDFWQSDTGSFALSISAPIINRKPTIRCWNEIPYFQVEMHNTSNRPLQIWTEDSFEDYDSLTLQILAIDGKALQKPIVVRRGHNNLGLISNESTATTSIAPSGTMTREISLHKYVSGERSAQAFYNDGEFLNFPALSDGAHTLKIRLAFQNMREDAPNSDRVWTGRVVSPAQDYVINGPYL